jgi:NNP family nitrate/nitrite transporter-like MFS transporter
MIPMIFRSFHLERALGRGPEAQTTALAAAQRETAAVVGFVAAIGALGGYFIPRSVGASIKATGGPGVAISYFVAFYAVCVVVTWWCYMRRSFMVASAPSLASADA